MAVVVAVLGLFFASLSFVSANSRGHQLAAGAPALGGDSTVAALGLPQRITVHVTGAGETVSGLADRFGIAAETIRWANGLDPSVEELPSGTHLTILPLSGILHVVREGETVEDLAMRYQSLAAAIRLVNRLAPDAEPSVGATLLVPGGRPALAAAPRFSPSARGMMRPDPEGDASRTFFAHADRRPLVDAPAPGPDAAAEASASAASNSPIVSQQYTVEAGDTVRGIAARFGVRAATLLASNNLPSADLLSIGQELSVPAEDGVLYQVREGESLRDIAERYGVAGEKIVRVNGLRNPDLLPIGRQLLVPGAAVAERVAEQKLATLRLAAASRAAAASRRYVVQPGDTLGELAELFGTSSRAIAQANGLEPPYLIVVGQELAIPGAGSAGRSASAPARASAPPAPAASAIAGSVVGIARQYLGAPYRWGGTSPSGFDCSGYVWFVFRNAGRPVPRDLYGQWQSGAPVPYADLQPGDLVFFSNTYMPGLSHNGIYLGGGFFINAQTERTGVRITSMAEEYWASRYTGARRVP